MNEIWWDNHRALKLTHNISEINQIRASNHISTISCHSCKWAFQKTSKDWIFALMERKQKTNQILTATQKIKTHKLTGNRILISSCCYETTPAAKFSLSPHCFSHLLHSLYSSTFFSLFILEGSSALSVLILWLVLCQYDKLCKSTVVKNFIDHSPVTINYTYRCMYTHLYTHDTHTPLPFVGECEYGFKNVENKRYMII